MIDATGNVVYFNVVLNYAVMFEEEGTLGKKDFIARWREIDDSNELSSKIKVEIHMLTFT